jgi:Ca-activated chloride channel family protein
LENPDAFADVFQKEFYLSSVTAATGVEIHIPLNDGLSLVDASGYPIKVTRGRAVIHPGDLRSGQVRKLFLTFGVPTQSQATFNIKDIAVHYIYNEKPFVASLSKSFQIACVEDEREAISSIKKSEWEQQVMQDDYNKLRESVSKDIKEGKQEKALERIHSYHMRKQQLNAIVGSAKVAENLDKDLNELRSFVKDTFQGEPAAVIKKQKARAKALQYEGYKGRLTK